MEHAGKTIANVTEIIDGNRYERCRFENCNLVFRGGEIPHISDCNFDNCTWQFADAAERTLIFMHHLYHGMGSGGAQLIEATLAAMRQPPVAQPPPSTNPPAFE
jgi:uncharacterized protein YjbI with pentapeptide repeats